MTLRERTHVEREHRTGCAVEGCVRPVKDVHCSMHSARLSRTGELGPVGPLINVNRDHDVVFWEQVVPTGFCWEWEGKVTFEGYGYMWFDGTTRPAHRIAYEFLVGPIPDGLVIDHLCRVRNCMNPDHMEIVTPAENSRRANVFKMARTHCTHGHEWTPENTLPMGDSIRCRQCVLVRKHRKTRECSYDAFCDSPAHLRRTYWRKAA